MPRISVLPSQVADQIAAGEVVERPASVVKELIENAFDAGATDIEVHVTEGGRGEIRVSDDGCGMDADDAVLCVSRHATSKIRSATDLVGVKSCGFRGEALPAIASVSRFEVLTATADGNGTRVRVTGGVAEPVEQAARRRGTTITVQQLFFNTPARQKFLRSARSEWRAVADTVVTLALTRRDVAFRVLHDGRELLNLQRAPDLRARVVAIWGEELAQKFVEVEGVSGVLQVRGLVERPADAGTGSRRAFLTVNGRPIRDGGITRAIESAFRSTLPPGVRPGFLIELTLPGGDVDVNVHPAKAEVRFHNRWVVERAVEQVVQRALGTADAAPWVGRTWSPAEARAGWDGGALLAPPLPSVGVPVVGLFASSADMPTDAAGQDWQGERAAPEPALPALLQLRRTWIMYEHDDGVVLIDQHSAHERILYERFLQALDGGAFPSQRLLFPETVHLSPEDADAFEAHAEALRRFGYEIESFGGHTLIVHAVPVPHPRFDATRCLQDTLAAASGARAAQAHSQHEALAATIGCKAAIKAGDVLSQTEMQALVRDLTRTRLAAHDVHGRSTIVRLSWDELERRFGRR